LRKKLAQRERNLTARTNGALRSCENGSRRGYESESRRNCRAARIDKGGTDQRHFAGLELPRQIESGGVSRTCRKPEQYSQRQKDTVTFPHLNRTPLSLTKQ